MKVALIHDWIIEIGGSEACLKEIYSLFPGDVYTLVFCKENLSSLGIPEQRVKASFLQRLPGIRRLYRNFLPLMPYAVEQFDLSAYDLIISSSHAVAKGIIRQANQVHICYCHTPMRYAWDLYHPYMQSQAARGIKGPLAKMILHYLRLWDLCSASRVDHFVANSIYTQHRIKSIYRRASTVIYPPVDVKDFQVWTRKENFFMAASRFVPYKRMDLIVEAFNLMPEKRLIIAGDGPELKKVRQRARKNVEFVGWQTRESLKELLGRARAFIFCAQEDFGILPVEAQACGTPVIAYGKGGVLESVVEGKTGFFFREQSAASIVEAIKEFEKKEEGLDPIVIRRNAERFDKERFRKEFKELVDKILNRHPLP